MTPVERMARAVYEDRNGYGCKAWGSLPSSHKRPYLSDARAAIKAIREPSKAMIEAALSRSHADAPETMYHSIWKSMIDAALSES